MLPIASPAVAVCAAKVISTIMSWGHVGIVFNSVWVNLCMYVATIAGFFHGRKRSRISRFCGDWVLVPDTVTCRVLMILFAFFQRGDSVLPKLDGPVLTAVPLSTITTVKKKL